MRLDFPTLERPENDTSGGPWGGSARISGASVTNRQCWRKSCGGKSDGRSMLDRMRGIRSGGQVSEFHLRPASDRCLIEPAESAIRGRHDAGECGSSLVYRLPAAFRPADSVL